MQEYLLPIGIDGSAFANNLQKMRLMLTQLRDEAKLAADNMSSGFSSAGKAASVITGESAKAVNSIKDESKAIADNNKQFVATIDLLSKLAASQGKAFASDQLAKYSAAVKTLQSGLTDALAKGAANFDISKLQEIDTQLQNVTDAAEQLRIIVSFLQENLNDLQLNPEETIQLQNYLKLIESAFTEFDNRKISIPVEIDATSITKAAEQIDETLQIKPSIVFSPEEINSIIEQIQEQVNSQHVDINVLGNAAAQGGEALQTLAPESADFKTLSQSIDLANDKLSQFVNQSKNVGVSIVELRNNLLAKKTELFNTTDVQTAGQLEKEIESLEQQIIHFGNASKTGLENFGNELVDAEGKSSKLTTRIREITNLIASGAIIKGTPQFEALITEAAQLTDELGDTRAQIKLLASDTSHLDAGIQAVQGIVGVFAAAQGAVALLGGENKDLEKTLVKVNAAMSLLQGIQQVGQLLDKNSALNKYLLLTLGKQQTIQNSQQAASTTALSGAEKEAALSQQELNVAMEANPAGILLLAIGALITAYTIFGNSAEKAEEDQKNLNQAVASANEQMVLLAKAYSSVYTNNSKQAENAVALAQAQGKSESAIAVLKQKALEARIAENKSLLSNLGLTEQSLKLNETELLVRQEQLQSILDQAKFGSELTKDEQAKADALRSQISSLQAITGPAREAINNIKDANNQIAVDAAAASQKGYQDSLKSATAFAEAKAVLAKEGTEDELNAQITAIRAEQRESLANINLTAGERFKINVDADKKIRDTKRAFAAQELTNEISNQQAIVSASIEGSEEEYRAKKDILDKQAQIDILNAQDNAAKIREINAKVAKEKAALDDQYDTSIRQDAANTEIAAINQKLDAVEKGTDKELELKKTLIDNQALLEVIGAANSIKNEVLRTEKIKEIYAKAEADKLALNRDF